MTYIFSNFLMCMLLAAIVGGIIGWLLRQFLMGNRLAELESEWRNKLGLAESERETLAGRLKDADGSLAGWRQKFASLEADHGKLQADFSATSGRIPALEAAVAGWTAKSASWNADRAKLATDLDACGKSRGLLEAQIAEWGVRAKAWDTERAQLMAKLKAAADEDAVEDANYQKTIDQLRADVSSLSGKLAAADRANKELEAKAATLAADLKKAVAEDVSDDTVFQAKIDQLGADIGGLKAKLTAAEAAARDWESRHAAVSGAVTGMESKLTAAETKAKDWESKHGSLSMQLQKAQAAEAAEGAQLRHAMESLQGDVAKLRTELTAANAKAADWESKHAAISAQLQKVQASDAAEAGQLRKALESLQSDVAKLQAESSAAQAKASDWESKHAEVTMLLQKAHAADAADDAQFQKAIELLRGDVAGLQAKLSAAESQGRQWEGKHASASASLAAAAEAAKDWEAKFLALQNEHEGLKAELVKFTQDDAFEDADFKRAIQNLRNKVATMESQLAGIQKERDKAASERDRLAADLKAAMAEDAVEDTRYQQTITQLRGEVSAIQAKSSALESDLSRVKAELKASQADRDKLVMDMQQTAQHREVVEVLRAEQTTLHTRLAAAEKASAEWATRYSALEAKQTAAKPAPLAMAAAAGAGAGSATVAAGSDPNFHALARRFESFLVKTQRDGYGDIERIEGIGPVYGQKLRSVGIAWVRELLDQGGAPAGRDRISEDTGIKRELILKWVNSADLLRIDGVTPDWAELLEESGVDTVKELRGRVPENLHKKMTETNEQGKFARTVPELDAVRRWIDLAKRMDPKVTH